MRNPKGAHHENHSPNLVRSKNSFGLHANGSASRGHEVAIVTSRIRTDSSKQRIATFVMEHELPVEREVVFTNKEWKAGFLEKIGSVLHFDDSKEELERIEAKGIQAVEVPHPPGPRR